MATAAIKIPSKIKIAPALARFGRGFLHHIKISISGYQNKLKVSSTTNLSGMDIALGDTDRGSSESRAATTAHSRCIVESLDSELPRSLCCFF